MIDTDFENILFLNIPRNVREIETTKLDSIFGVKKIKKKNNTTLKQNKKCWHCTYPFNGIPCIIPMTRYEDAYQGYGNFCSFNCAYSYIQEHDIYRKHEVLVYLYEMYYKQYGGYDTIKRAPPHIVLDAYSENGISIEEYRESFSVVDLNICPSVPIPKRNNIIIERKKIRNNRIFEIPENLS